MQLVQQREGKTEMTMTMADGEAMRTEIGFVQSNRQKNIT